MTRRLIAMFFVLILSLPCLAVVDISQDILRSQESVCGNIVNTGVMSRGGYLICIDTSVNQIVATQPRVVPRLIRR